MTSTRTPIESHDSEVNLLIEAERALRAPISVLRMLIEGGDSELRERAVRELNHIEQRARDLTDLAHPRATRSIPTTTAEVARSMRESLDVSQRRRCHFVVDSPDETLFVDPRILTRALVRSASQRLDHDTRSELLVHMHSQEESVTISLVDTDPPPASSSVDEGPEAPETLHEMLLVRDVERLGGRAQLHRVGEHRCAVVILPKLGSSAEGGAR